MVLLGPNMQIIEDYFNGPLSLAYHPYHIIRYCCTVNLLTSGNKMSLNALVTRVKQYKY
jgi:hypothetical protein